MEAQPIRASFVLQEDDVLTAARLSHAPHVTGLRRALLLLAAVFAGIALLRTVTAGEAPDPVFGAVAGVTAFMALATPMFVERSLRRKLPEVKALGQPVTLALMEDRLRHEVAGLADTTAAIDALHNVEDRACGVLLWVAPGEAFWIPDRAFATPDDRAAFLRRLRAGLDLPAAALDA